ncbi:hypothetical protein IV203_006977 [Nitzschia inconspicua]|uniref:Uncharacterized protein n=1 Tax=Nitzschia inconspicua TaxID=303405 RepID=A0A9K3KDZ3_9STRA|nr:hypothetical protein IV203_006977 [Nitzschia inconspicua]
MKRSSSVAALPHDPQPEESQWNYQDDLLATNMMLVSIEEETNHSFMQRNQQGSMGSIASSRCSSRGSLSGWGSAASRKSYKVDLCSLGNLEDAQQQQPKQDSSQRNSSKGSTQRIVTAGSSHPVSASSSHSAIPADSGDTWGFFVDSAF